MKKTQFELPLKLKSLKRNLIRKLSDFETIEKIGKGFFLL